jgi:hypothetical protein
MSSPHVWSAVVLFFVLVLSPIVEFLCLGWLRRRTDIVEGFTEAAIETYFSTFHPSEVANSQGDWRKAFARYYCSQFGRRRFLLPLLLLAGISGLLFCWIGLSLPALLETGSIASGHFPVLATVAVMGACMWILFDEITRWYCSDLTPADVYWWCLRLAIAVPMGYAIRDIVSKDLAMPLVFCLGAFPITQLMTIARRIANKKMGFADSEKQEVSELQSLQGVDRSKAEIFSSEGITTILQLAYSDPIRLTIRTGLSYSYIVDCTSQALLWIYLEKDVALLRQGALRGAYEVLDFWLDLVEPTAMAEAQPVLAEMARVLNRSEDSLKNILKQVALDPYTQFLYLSWSGSPENAFTAAQKKVLFEFREKKGTKHHGKP